MTAGTDEVLMMGTDPSASARHRTSIGIYRFFRGQGVPVYEIVYFIYKVLRLLWMNEDRAHAELYWASYEDYVDYTKRSTAFQNALIKIPDILTAAKPTASAYSVAGMLAALFTAYMAKLDNRRLATSAHERTDQRAVHRSVGGVPAEPRVTFETDARVSRVLHDDERVTGVEINGHRVETADDYVLCLQVNELNALLAGDIERMAPSLSRIELLGDSWSNGIQYFMPSIPPAWEKYVGRATLKLDSPWAIVFTIQTDNPASWSNVKFPPGTVANLSLVFSNATVPGPVTGKTVKQCTKKELFAECLAQIGGDQAGLFDCAVMDPDLKHLARAYYEEHKKDYAGWDTSFVAETDEIIVNDGPLFVANPNAVRNEPGNATEIRQPVRRRRVHAGEGPRADHGGRQRERQAMRAGHLREVRVALRRPPIRHHRAAVRVPADGRRLLLPARQGAPLVPVAPPRSRRRRAGHVLGAAALRPPASLRDSGRRCSS